MSVNFCLQVLKNSYNYKNHEITITISHENVMEIAVVKKAHKIYKQMYK